MKQGPAFFLSKGGACNKTRLVVTQGITMCKVREHVRKHFPEIERGTLQRTAEDKVPKRFTSSVALKHLERQSFTIAVLEICNVVMCLKWITTSKERKQLSVMI